MSVAALSVSELTDRIKEVLETGFPDVWVTGEIGNYTRARSGHVYLTLKDEGAALDAVIWRNTADRLRHEIGPGMEVLAHGRLNLYAPRGQYQLTIKTIEPRGAGALAQAFEKLRAKLEAEGLFDAELKRPIPYLPAAIGIVTSPTGAAVRDIIKVVRRRFPGTALVLAPARVQGEGAAEEVARGIERLNARGGLDVLIVGRGGGSLEDLWAFNEEPVARAIAASEIPVISAVGHEVDVTIADYVAALRGGVCSLEFGVGGMRVQSLEVDLAALRRHMVLVYSGLPRSSGINNWQVTKAFLDGDAAVRGHLEGIAAATRQAKQALLSGDVPELARAVDEEWSHRRELAPGVSTEAIDALLQAGRDAGALAGKVCGAGGGGCVFLLTRDGCRESVEQAARQQGMEVLDFEFAARGLSVVT
jgi:hypothetical protein